jgi:hypothetical protein
VVPWDRVSGQSPALALNSMQYSWAGTAMSRHLTAVLSC